MEDDPRFEFTVKEVDPRIHFALVCGAKVLFYDHIEFNSKHLFHQVVNDNCILNTLCFFQPFRFQNVTSFYYVNVAVLSCH